MDPFLPGDIAVMVLRYLAANKCEGAALSLIEEMPLLKGYVPPKPPAVSKNDYVKHLARSYGTGLKDLLTDYGNSKILVEEMLDSSSILPSYGSDSLMSKLKAYQEVASSSSGSSSHNHASPSSSSKRNEIQVPEPVRVEQFTNTEAYQCMECSKRRAAEKNRSVTDSGCQTEEYTAVQFGLQDDIPRIFYNTLLSDMDLQQKIAQTINEHIEDPEEPQRGDVVQQISSKAETEIDKFLVELLKDLPDDSSSGMHLHPGGNGGPTSFADVGNSLSSIFKDTEIILGHSSNNQSIGMTKDGPEKFQRSTTVEQVYSSNDEQALSTPPTNDAACGSSTKYSTDANNSSKTPNRPSSSVKRITPTPVPANAPPAVFNSSILIEKKRIDFDGGASAKCSVKTATIEPPAWQRLNRKPISPKIPDLETQKVTLNTRVRMDIGETVLNLGSDESRTNRTQSRTVRPGPDETSKICPPAAPRTREGIPSSTHKRKTTPVKLTPEKAKNSDFLHIYHEGSLNKLDQLKQSTNGNIDSSVKKTPAVLSSAPLALVNENSQPDVTPMQQMFPVDHLPSISSSTLKTISPTALQRLIASASKVGSTMPAANFFNNKKKSFSTPRKRKHVRSLTFATPPSLKSGTPGFEPKHGFETKTSKKRKPTEDLYSAESRSKKRLNWPDSEKKKNLNKHRDKSPGHSLKTEDSKEGISASVITTTASTPMSLPSDKSQVTAKESMPTILEESMSAITADVSITIPVTQSSPNPETNMRANQVSTPNNEIPIQSENFVIATQPSGNSETSGSQIIHVLGETNGLIPISLTADGQMIFQRSPHVSCVRSPHIFTSCVSLPGNAEGSTPMEKILSEPRPDLSTSNVLTLHANSPAASSTELPPLPVQTNPLQERPPLPAQPSPIPKQPPLPVQTYPVIPVQERPPLPAQPSPIPKQPPLPRQPYPLQEEPRLPAEPPLPVQTCSLLEKPPFPAQPPLPVQPYSLQEKLPPLPVRSYPSQQVLQPPPPPLPVQPHPLQHHVPPPPPPPLEPPVPTVPSSSTVTAAIPPTTKSERTSRATLTLSKENAPSYPKSATAPVVNVSSSSLMESDKPGKSKRKKKSIENRSNKESAETTNDSRTSKSGHSKQENAQHQRDSRKEKSKRVSSDGSSKSHRKSDPVRVEPPKSPLKSSPETDSKITSRSNRGRRSKSKEKSSKKPKLTTEDLFGDLSDLTMTPTPKTPKSCNKKEIKLPVDVIAAQSVASEAVALGHPRRSPRKHSVIPNPSQRQKVSLDKTIPPNEKPFTFPSGNASEIRPSSVPDIPHSSNSNAVSQDSIPFSIVPAPLGFPEPTPIKNFIETGYLGLSNHGFISPLITPLKSMPHLNLNETQFTLPPTPRVIDDQDSNSNSTHSLRLFDGSLYPVNFLASTPLKHGLPRTPGKESNSSNSRSPPPPPAPVEKQGERKEIPQSNKPLPTIPQNIPSIIVSTSKDVPSSSSPSKSDGEISSSDEDEPAKAITMATKSEPAPKDKGGSSSSTAPPIPNASKPQVLVSSSSCNLPRNIPACPPNTQPHVPLTVDPCMRHMPNSNFEFQVGNRGKKLTISEQETLYTLLEIGSSQSRLVNNRKPELPKPKPTENVSAPPKKSTASDESKRPFNLLRNTNVSDLIKYIHRQNAPQGVQQAPRK